MSDIEGLLKIYMPGLPHTSSSPGAGELINSLSELKCHDEFCPSAPGLRIDR